MKKITFSILLITAFCLSACGQKGPLIIDIPPGQSTQQSADGVNKSLSVEGDKQLEADKALADELESGEAE